MCIRIRSPPHQDRVVLRIGRRRHRRDSSDEQDVAKYLLAGADVVMTASALLRHGPSPRPSRSDGLSDWMARKGFGSIDQFRGILLMPTGMDKAAHECAGYVSALEAANSSTYGPW